METIFVTKEECGVRLDQFLAERYRPKYSRTYFQGLIREGLVLVDGKRVKKREQLEGGEEVEVCFVFAQEASAEPQNLPLEILFEDEHILVVNKAAGMVVHPAPGHPDQTFVNALLYHCGGLELGDPLRPGIVHRLDRDTSGVLIAAKTSEAHRGLVESFSLRKVEKLYLALCVGSPGKGVVKTRIGRDAIHRKKMAVVAEGRGKEAVTHYRTLQVGLDGVSLVEMRLITGRTHQARVHMRHLNTPILGDPVYGFARINQRYGIDRQQLHAYQLTVEHPISKERMSFTAPIPKWPICIAG